MLEFICFFQFWHCLLCFVWVLGAFVFLWAIGRTLLPMYNTCIRAIKEFF